MTRISRFNLFGPLLGSLLALAACGGGGGGGGGTPTAVPTPNATPTTPGSGDTVVIGTKAGLCQPGDVARVDVDSGGKARFPLVNSDATCDTPKDNRKEEYTLILYNTSGSPLSFQLFAPIESTPIATSALTRTRQNPAVDENEPLKPPVASSDQPTGAKPTDREAQQMARFKTIPRVSPSVRSLLGMTTPRAAGPGDEAEFRIRSSVSDSKVFTTTSAILRYQGLNINLWMDRDAPYCFTTATVLTPPIPLCGNMDTLNNVHLKLAADIFDGNIYPLLKLLLGNPSDVDVNTRIDVVITPILNRDIHTASYFDSRNLLPFDPISNPGSNEKEVIFVHAPDSLGNYMNKLFGDSETWFGLPADSYVNKSLAAWLAFQTTKIISFNQHVFVSEAAAEDDWIDDGMGAVMADLCGFNIWRSAVWRFLATPQLHDLRVSDDLDQPATTGLNYLFMLYYLQSQIDKPFTDSDGDGYADGLSVFQKLLVSGKTGTENLEEAADFSFDSAKETKFQAIFKDWTIALATSGTDRADLQQTGQTAVKYYYRFTPEDETVYGPTTIDDGTGSIRLGGSGHIGMDLNTFVYEDGIRFENTDEHLLAPGNTLFGYVYPYAAMYVRLGGLFQAVQTISLKGSSSALKGFLIRRSNITYPRVYSESIFGSIDQHAEDLQTAGPNPYWTGEGIAKKIDYASLVDSADVGEEAQEFLSIIGKIDAPGTIAVCPADYDECATSTTAPDTDKYILDVPDLVGRTDEGDLAVIVRRQFDNGSDTSSLKPMLAIVSSKDVPYPYLPHPIRGPVVGNTDTRQPYRWMTSQLICGDDQGGDPPVAQPPPNPDLYTNIVGSRCVVRDEVDSPKLVYEGLVENTGTIPVMTSPGPPITFGPWNGNILGWDCDTTPDLIEKPPVGVDTAGYGTGGLFPVTDLETSPSSLGGYEWLNDRYGTDTFMEISYDGSPYPDVLFAREFLLPVPAYPPVGDETTPPYDPRSVNGLTMNCHLLTSSAPIPPPPDTVPDSPDDFLAAGEITVPASLPEQILSEMARGRIGIGGADEDTFLDAKYDDGDVFAVDRDSRDSDSNCVGVDEGNNLNQWTVKTGEGSILWGNVTPREPHIRGNLQGSLNNSALAVWDTSGSQRIYTNVETDTTPCAGDTCGPYGTSSAQQVLHLTPGKSYTIIVGGIENTTGPYELRIRKINRKLWNGTNPDRKMNRFIMYDSLAGEPGCDSVTTE
ncbi:MAG: hypothetical protein V1495_06435 [Pseudomonadota bacterium]